MIEAVQDRLVSEIAACASDPLRYVHLNFPWGTGELAAHPGPDVWQERTLAYIRDEIQSKRFPIQVAVASGHGIGKSALMAMLVKWALSTKPGTRGIVTAGKEAQLRTKTWPELAKWNRMGLDADWFEVKATSISSNEPGRDLVWRVDASAWSERNTEAFAGLHNHGKRIILGMDEGSVIPDLIYEVAEGALTDSDTEIIWIVFGNPTRATGRFRECFGKYRSRWFTQNVDSRSSRFTNHAKITEWAEDEGEDSDFFKVRVRGEFPNQSIDQLIPTDTVEAARKADAFHNPFESAVIGVDVGRTQAESVICVRIGRDARSYRWNNRREPDAMLTASRIGETIDDLRKIHAHVGGVFVDTGDSGGAVCDRVRQLGYPVTPIGFGSAATAHDRYENKGAEMWCGMRDWLKTGGAIPDDPILAAQLTGRECGYDKHNRIRLERKEDMVTRGLESPDRADALALTFAHPVAPRDRGMMGGDRCRPANYTSALEE